MSIKGLILKYFFRWVAYCGSTKGAKSLQWNEGKIIKIDSPSNLIDELTKSGFKSSKKIREATLEDVFIDLTGKSLRED